MEILLPRRIEIRHRFPWVLPVVTSEGTSVPVRSAPSEDPGPVAQGHLPRSSLTDTRVSFREVLPAPLHQLANPESETGRRYDEWGLAAMDAQSGHGFVASASEGMIPARCGR